MTTVKTLVRALYQTGDLPLRAHAEDVYIVARDSGEDSVEAVANAMDFYGFDGSIAYEVALDLSEGI